jgi:hypothetical protein
LTEKNKILFSEMIELWEDELGDNGLSLLEFRLNLIIYFHILYNFKISMYVRLFFWFIKTLYQS